MNRLRIMGHCLLWLGFVAAAVAMVAQKEIDLLPSTEQAALELINPQLKIPKNELRLLLNDRSFAEISQEELSAIVGQLNAWHQASDQKQTEQSSTNPITKAKLIQYRTARLTNMWSVIPWVWYLIAVFVGFCGVVLLRVSSQPVDPSQENQHSDLDFLQNALNRLIENIQRLENKFSQMHPEQIYQYIDEHCVPYFADFADSRNVLATRFGLTAFGDIMTEFASGERFMNRAWSAAADGYIQESEDSVTRALVFLKRAQELLSQQSTAASAGV